MKDLDKKEYLLRWIYDRLTLTHRENPNADYMIKLGEIIKEFEGARESKSAVPKELVELKQNEYRCKMCLNVYEKEWSDEEALNESKEIFGGDPTVENSDVVCDDCWKKLGFD